MHKNSIIVISFLISACLGIPENINPIQNFDLNKYLGKWYEIARLDHSFERGLENVTADYSLLDDNGVRVINRGFSPNENEWKEAEGKAYFVRSENEGYLKVSFFGPFYGSYIIFELDKKNYQYAFVCSSSKSYLWLLSRTSNISKDLLDQFIEKSKKLGFNTDELIFVKQN